MSKREISLVRRWQTGAAFYLPRLRWALGGLRFNPGVTSRQQLASYLGDPNDLENSEDRRGAGGHGNQHVRLRRAQIDSKRSARLQWQSAAASRGRRPVLCSATIANASNFFRIEEMEIRSALGEVCRIFSRDPSLGRGHAGLEGIQRIKMQRGGEVNVAGAGRRSAPPISGWPLDAVIGCGFDQR